MSSLTLAAPRCNCSFVWQQCTAHETRTGKFRNSRTYPGISCLCFTPECGCNIDFWAAGLAEMTDEIDNQSRTPFTACSTPEPLKTMLELRSEACYCAIVIHSCSSSVRIQTLGPRILMDCDCTIRFRFRGPSGSSHDEHQRHMTGQRWDVNTPGSTAAPFGPVRHSAASDTTLTQKNLLRTSYHSPMRPATDPAQGPNPVAPLTQSAAALKSLSESKGDVEGKKLDAPTAKGVDGRQGSVLKTAHSHLYTPYQTVLKHCGIRIQEQIEKMDTRHLRLSRA